MQKPLAFVLLRIAVAIQALAMGIICLRAGSVLGSWLFLNLDCPEIFSLMTDRVAGVGLLLASGRLFFCWSGSAFLYTGMISLLLTVCSFVTGGKFMGHLVFFSEALRYGVPLLLWWFSLSRSPQSPRTLSCLSRGLCLLTSATFVGHGIKAWCLHPVFTDYLITSFSLSGISGLSEAQAGILLRGIGLADITASVFLLLRPASLPGRVALSYMVIWGFLTALIRTICHPGIPGLEQFLLRPVHSAGPLLAAYLLFRVPEVSQSFRLFFHITFNFPDVIHILKKGLKS